MKATGSASAAFAKSKHRQKPIFIDESEEDDSDEVLDFTPLQVHYLDLKEKFESYSIKEVDFSSEGEDTESEWDNIFTKHFNDNIPTTITKDSMAIVPFQKR